MSVALVIQVMLHLLFPVVTTKEQTNLNQTQAKPKPSQTQTQTETKEIDTVQTKHVQLKQKQQASKQANQNKNNSLKQKHQPPKKKKNNQYPNPKKPPQNRFSPAFLPTNPDSSSRESCRVTRGCPQYPLRFLWIPPPGSPLKKPSGGGRALIFCFLF